MKILWIIPVLLVSIPVVWYNVQSHYQKSRAFDNAFKVEVKDTIKEFADKNNTDANKSKAAKEQLSTKQGKIIAKKKTVDAFEQQMQEFDKSFDDAWDKF
jgi:hypothetical protein